MTKKSYPPICCFDS